MSVLVVDAANVVGSRPGWRWWTDRAGAARRLHDTVAPLVGPSERVVLVLEGAARGGLAAGTTPSGVQVTHSSGSGDDEVVSVVTAAMRGNCCADDDLDVQRCTDPVGGCRVVTADRELVGRVRALGALTRSPQWLWARAADESPIDTLGGSAHRAGPEHLT